MNISPRQSGEDVYHLVGWHSDHGAIAKLSFVHGLLFLVCVTRTLRLIHLSWQMWTCFGKRKVEMYNYGGKLSRQDHWTLFFTEKPEQGTWHHDIFGMFCYESCCGREVTGLLGCYSVGQETATGEKEAYHSSPDIHPHSWMHCGIH